MEETKGDTRTRFTVEVMADHWEWLGHSDGKRQREFLNLIFKLYGGEFPIEGSSV